MTRDLGVCAAIALSAPLAATAGGGIGAALAPASADGALVAVTAGALLPLLALRLLRPESSRASRALHVALALPALAALLVPRSALAVSWLSLATLYLGLDATVHAARAAARAGTSSATRALFTIGAAIPPALLWLSALLVLFNTQLLMASVRLAHLTPTRRSDERAMVLETEDGLRLAATYTPGRPGAPGVVLAHGVADSSRRLAPWADRLARLGYHGLRFDFRAHGESAGAVCTYGQREASDVRAAVRALRSMPGVDRDRVAVVGASMGGGSVLAAAPSLEGVRALVLLAPASRYPPLVHRRLGWLGPFERPLLRMSARFARAAGQTPLTEWIPMRRDVAIPTMVVHGSADEAIPIALSERLVRARPHAELLRVPGAGHDELSHEVLSRERVWSRVRRFLARAF